MDIKTQGFSLNKLWENSLQVHFFLIHQSRFTAILTDFSFQDGSVMDKEPWEGSV